MQIESIIYFNTNLCTFIICMYVDSLNLLIINFLFEGKSGEKVWSSFLIFQIFHFHLPGLSWLAG